MPRDELLQTSHYLKTVALKSINRDPAQEMKVTAKIASPAEFTTQLQSVLQQNKNPVFTNVKISDVDLNCDTQNHLLVLHGDIEFNKVNFKTTVIGVSAPKAMMLQCKFTEELKDCNFQQGLFSETVFEKNVKTTDFQGSSFVKGEFNNIEHCNFTNANCTQTTFRGDITGFTCFAGANLKDTKFEGKIGEMVCFIGSNFDLKMMTKGGIYTVDQLKKVAKQLSDDDLNKLEMVLSKSHEQVKKQVDDSAAKKMDYHVNIHHVDALNMARNAVSDEIACRTQNSNSVRI